MLVLKLIAMLKDKVRAHIDENKTRLIDISDEIHANPEVANEEVKASRLLAGELEKAGFKVDLGVAGLDTAILAVHPDQSDGPTIAILGEYDALPGIGPRPFQSSGPVFPAGIPQCRCDSTSDSYAGSGV